jgi:hypothetical protein
MKTQILGIVIYLLSFSLWAANPIWLEGVTDDRYEITVYRSATCGCCKGWVNHLKDHNFDVKDVTVDDVNIYKSQLNVPTQAASCHTAVVDGITIEGHVPAQAIKSLLADKGDVRLLTVPAMPSGTPGMDTPGAVKSDFHVYSITKEDKVSIFKSYSDY